MKHKARLVAKGYTQEFGVDYHEVFSQLANLVTVRVFIVVATAYSWPLHQLNINNAFLHGFSKDDIYMSILQDFKGAKQGQVCKLLNSLYGLKQALREWNTEFTRQLMSYGFRSSSYDPCLFTKSRGVSFFCLIVYVDDTLIKGPSIELISDIVQFLDATFTIKDLGQLSISWVWKLQEGKMELLSTRGNMCLELLFHLVCSFSRELRYSPTA